MSNHYLADASPSVGSLKCEPMTIAEIDAHPDAGRIWATVSSLKKEIKDTIEQLEDEADDRMDAAANDAWNTCRDLLSNAIAFSLTDECRAMSRDEVLAKIKECLS